MEYYSNFKKYTHKNQRLAIFGKEIDGELEVFKLVCNPKDRFIKNIAKAVYANWSKKDNSKEWNDYLSQFHPVIEKVVIEEGDSAKYTFDKYCSFYYQIKEKQMKYKMNYLFCDNHVINLPKTAKKINKID